ncbi:hypothetical protein W01_10070 [Candidatus Nitrotoga sp. AM1P]|nr:hypothetical protein W01_10070 [Candidatus Nitrotoga sp. AM1P]
MGEHTFYVGGSIGEAGYRAFPSRVPNIDDKDTGYKIYGGYQIDKNWGVETTYFDLGKATVHDSVNNGFAITPVYASIGATAWGFAGTFTTPIYNNVSLFGKIGLIRSELKARASIRGVDNQAKEFSTGVNFGLGAKYDFTRNFVIRAEWERLEMQVNNQMSTVNSDVDFLSAGITYKF